MNEEIVQLTYQEITNPILRLLVYFLATAVVALATALVYTYKQWRTDAKELISFNQEAIKGYSEVGNALDRIADELREVRQLLTKNK